MPRKESPESLTECVRRFRELLERGETIEAVDRFYAQDVCVFENRALARSGKSACLSYERAELAAQPKPPEFKFVRVAVDEKASVAFLEYVVRFVDREQRPMRIEQVAVQEWHGGKIVEERFYYEGVVDEGD